MNVAELIEKLRAMPQDLPVYFINGDGLDIVNEVSESIIGMDENGEPLLDGGGIDIVLLHFVEG